MYCLEIGKLVIICIHAYAEKEASVSPVDDLVIPELESIYLRERSLTTAHELTSTKFD